MRNIEIPSCVLGAHGSEVLARTMDATVPPLRHLPGADAGHANTGTLRGTAIATSPTNRFGHNEEILPHNVKFKRH